MDKNKLQSLFISPESTLKQAMELLCKTAEKILLVVARKDKLLGTLTDGDIRRGILNGLTFADPIKKIIHPDFISLPAQGLNLYNQAKNLMINNKIEHIPLLNQRGGVVDLILLRDILKQTSEKSKKEINTYHNYVVIMAGGRGTRLEPFTRIFPKSLIPIGDTPIIEILMKKFAASGFNHFLYTLNYKKKYMQAFLKEMDPKFSIAWIEEDDFLGTAGSLSLLRDKLVDTFFVTNCDSILEINFEAVFKWHRDQKAAMTIIGCHKEVKVPFGVLDLQNGKLKNIVEKPLYNFTINTGVYVMEPMCLSLIHDAKKLDMNILIQKLIAKNYKVSVYPIHDGWFDVGQWKEYRESLKKIKC